MLGVNLFTKKDSFPSDVDAGGSHDSNPHGFIGFRLVFGDQGTADLFGDAGKFDIRGDLYIHNTLGLLVPDMRGLTLRDSYRANVRARFGHDRFFDLAETTIAADGFVYSGSGINRGISVGYGIGNWRFLLGAGTWVARGVSVEVGFMAAYLFKWKKWAIGGEFLLTVGRGESLRIIYLTQFDEGRALGPRPYFLIAYEWRIAG